MRKLVVTAALAAVPFVAAAAHDPSDRPPWDTSEDWRLIGFSDDRAEAMFLAKSLVERAGNVANVELLIITRSLDEEYGTDQVNEHYLVDCGTLAWRSTGSQSFKPKGITPPSITRVTSSDEPPDIPAYRAAFETACDTRPWSEEVVADPYRWAKARFSK